MVAVADINDPAFMEEQKTSMERILLLGNFYHDDEDEDTNVH